MSSEPKSGVIRHGHSSAASAQVKHRLRELPEPRILACKACRKKKHLCDRQKPSCTTCRAMEIECVYGERKPHATVFELQDILQKLQHKYAICLKAARKRTARKMASSQLLSKPLPYTSNIPTFQARPYQSDESYGGYHFDESFHTMRRTTRSVLSEPFGPSQLEPLANPIRYPTRIFSPVVRYPPTQTTRHMDPQDNSLAPLEPHPLELEVTDICSTALDRSPTLPTTPPEHALQDLNPPLIDSPYQRRTPTLQGTSNGIIHAPSLHFSRSTWWDCLLNTYTILPNGSYPAISVQGAATEISQDVYRFFKSASLWLTFFNVPLFFDVFHHAELRAAIQPALILSILAYAKFLQSDRDMNSGKSLEDRERARRQSVILRNLAQASFEASYNAGWLDLPLAQAAWVLVLFEISSHQDCTSHRMESAISVLDSVIRCLGLTSIDAMDPRAPIFSADAVPALGRPPPNGRRDQTLRTAPKARVIDLLTTLSTHPRGPSPPVSAAEGRAAVLPTPFDKWRSPADHPPLQDDLALVVSPGCPCHALSLSSSPEVLRSTPGWKTMPRWAPNANWAEIRKEEARRLVWSTVVMLGSDANARQAGGMPQLDLHVTKVENFALLYPGEENYSSLPGVDMAHSGKESHVALWCRTMMLWLACIRYASRHQPHLQLSGFSVSPTSTHDEEMRHRDSDFAMRAWMETVAIEEALNVHTCDTEQSLMYQARESMYLIRMQVSGGFRRFIPSPQTGVNFSQLDRDSAMKWIRQQNSISTTLLAATSGGDENPGHAMLVKRPFLVYPCMGALWRALELWRLDHSLTLAVEIALKFRRVMDWYQQIWPCTEIQRWTAKASDELELICTISGVNMT